MTGRHVGVVTAILAAAGLYACYSGVPLIWDGAHQFVSCLTEQRPYVYGTRFHSWPLWLPVVWASRWTQSYRTLAFLFGLPFALAPAAGVLLSWWVVRQSRPGMIVWAILGIAIAPLPGQIFWINDSIFQQHLFWPVFLGVLVPLTPFKRWVLGGLALFQLSHPVGTLLLGIAVLAGAAMAWREPSRRRELTLICLLLAALMLAGPLKLAIWPDAQARDEFHLLVALNRWRKGVAGLPLLGLAWFWGAGAMMFFAKWLRGRDWRATAKWLGRTALACAVVGAAIWICWASDAHRWAYALDYRRWLVPLTLPFFAACAVDACRKSVRGAARPSRGLIVPPPDPPHLRDSAAALCYVAAATFAALLGVQSMLWSQLTQRLVQDMNDAPGPVVPRWTLLWVRNTPLEHWATASYVAAMEGPAPRHVLLSVPEDRAALRAESPRIPLAPWDEGWVWPAPGPAGWLDYRPLVKGLKTGSERATSEPPAGASP